MLNITPWVGESNIGFNIIPISEFDMKKCHSRQQDLVGVKATSYQLSYSSFTNYKRKWFIYENLPGISFLVIKVISYGLAQRIIVIHRVSLVSTNFGRYVCGDNVYISVNDWRSLSLRN